MTTYVSTPERARQTPAGALRQRIADLEALRDRVDAELADTRARLRRLGLANTQAHRTIVPTGTDPSAVRAWGRRHGWTLGNRGRLPADLITAYVRAHTPGATP